MVFYFCKECGRSVCKVGDVFCVLSSVCLVKKKKEVSVSFGI